MLVIRPTPLCFFRPSSGSPLSMSRRLQYGMLGVPNLSFSLIFADILTQTYPSPLMVDSLHAILTSGKSLPPATYFIGNSYPALKNIRKVSTLTDAPNHSSPQMVHHSLCPDIMNFSYGARQTQSPPTSTFQFNLRYYLISFWNFCRMDH